MQVNSQKRENTQTTILALLLTHKGGCTLRQLNNDYYETEGEHIPWKELGYSSLLAFLYSMSKTVQIENKNNTFIIQGIASEKSKHVSKLVAGQKCQKPFFGRKFYKPNHYFPTTAPPRIRIPAEILSRIISLVNDHPDGVNKYYVLQEIHLCMPFANITMKDMEEQLQELSHTIFQTSTKIYPIHAKVKGFNHLKNYNNMTSNSKSQNGEKYKSLSVTVAGDEDSNDILNYDEEDILEFSHSDSFYSKSIKSKSTSSFIKETVFKYQDQETECLQNETPKIQHNNDTQIQMKLNNSIEKDEENVLDKKNVEILINERIKFRLEKLIQNHHDGIWCADLPKKYLEEYKVSLNYEELGFNSVREFASQLPDIFHCIQPHNAGDFMLYYAKREIPSNKIKENDKINNITDWYNIYETIDEEALPAEVSPDTCKILIPDNVMSIGEYVGYINVADLAQNEEPFIEVFVVEVFTPSFFWIQLRKKQKIFIKFMDDLHKFYTINHEQYVIPLVVLERGLNCACIYNGLWHRGIIKSVKPDLQVTVMFYDYGTLKTYSPGTVYYLHRMFSNLPAQAIPCGLINTRPYKGSKWSRGATYYFAVRTSKIPLVATIASVNIEDNSMIISLTDTLEEEDVHINDWLVEQNLAEHGKMVCMKKRNFPFQYYLECQKRFKQYKFSNTREMEINSENKTLLYNLNFDGNLSHNNNYKKVNNNKENSYNELILYKEKAKKSQSLEYNHSCKNDFSNEKINSFTINSEKKNTKKIESLYELLNLKIKSIHSKSNNNNHINKIKERGNERYLESSFILSNPIVKKLYEKSDSTKSNISSVVKNIKNDISDISRNTDTLSLSAKTKENSDMSNDTSLITLSAKKTKNNDVSNTDTSSIILSARNRKNNDVIIDNKYDILQKHNNIPKQYAYHFDVHTSEDELDFNDIRKSIGTCNEIYKTEYTDWSVLNKKQEKKYSQENVIKVPHETSFRKKNIPIAENCFIKAVYNSSYSTLNDKDIQWTSAGNINKMSDVSPLIIKNIEKRKKNISNNMTIVIPQKILETLTDEKFSEKLPNVPKNIEEIQSINLQEIDNVNNSKYTSNNDIFHNTNFKIHSEDYKQNDYICMKAIPKRKLLEKLLSLKDISSDILNIDSDDLSTSQESILSEDNNHNNNDKYTKEVYKNDINNEDTSNESPNSKIRPKCLPYSVEADITDLYTQESLKSMNNDLDLYKKEFSETSSKSLFANNTELVEYVPSDSILSQQSTLTEEFDLIKKYNSSEKPLLDMEIKKSEQLLKEESILNEEITQTQISSKKLISKSFMISNLDINEEEIPVTSSKSSEFDHLNL
ncbi:tudor domain-containing protein 5-like isoform X3 [Apis dorsata]|uniref:tudor domain-containing protein 5-like isoform X3 n=1 Tax=Apis dorsata TaxID=7462 RepID=UPI001293CCFB|nr:tudor domain-containing protein 5-like isoform X3 [Apis dorsata]